MVGVDLDPQSRKLAVELGVVDRCEEDLAAACPVSYTHLTLPTSVRIACPKSMPANRPSIFSMARIGTAS